MSNGGTESYWRQLPKVVVAHATFQKVLSGEPSESALAYPIQTYLGVKTPLTIVAEQDHPAFKTAGKLGRPFQIDFVGIDRRKKWSWGLETKIFDGTKRDRVVRDIVKLLLLADHPDTENASRYLLLLFPNTGGSKLSFANDMSIASHMISSTGQKSDNLFDVLLPWNPDEQPVSVGKLPAQLQKEFGRAIEDLKADSIRSSFKIRLLERDWSDDFACALWQIKLGDKKSISRSELP
jgi:hypothetical protein